jgi:hypothetical protein
MEAGGGRYIFQLLWIKWKVVLVDFQSGAKDEDIKNMIFIFNVLVLIFYEYNYDNNLFFIIIIILSVLFDIMF